MHDSSNCPICRGLPDEGTLTDEEFNAFVAACTEELAAKQERFQLTISGARTWSHEMSDCTLKVGDNMFAMIPIGTHSGKCQTWLWAWANEDFPENARIASRRLQALHAVTGFRVFLDEGTRATETDAQVFTALAVHFLDAIAFFRAPSDGLTLFLAVHAIASPR